jgi:hypothetical protein
VEIDWRTREGPKGTFGGTGNILEGRENNR